MPYLLDTHTFLWMAADPDRLSADVRGVVRDRSNELFLSAASGWEMAILQHLGRIELSDKPQRFVPEAMQQLGIKPIPIGFTTAISSAMLPLIHRDPFDRILIAEALKENLTVMTKDKKFTDYGVNVFW